MLIPIKRMYERYEREKEESDTSAFFTLLYLGEFLTKVIVCTILSGVEEDRERNRYRISHDLVRADGIGVWANALENILTGPCSQFLKDGFKDLRTDIIKQQTASNTWQYESVVQMDQVLKSFNIDNNSIPQKPSLRDWFKRFALLRNKTRGHGATLAHQCSQAVPSLKKSIDDIVNNLLIFEWQWAYLHRNLSGKYRVSRISEESNHFETLTRSRNEIFPDGIYVHRNIPILVELLESDPELTDFFIPNGQFRKSEYEVMSYISNRTKRVEASKWTVPITSLPDSETHGSSMLDLSGKIFTNVPSVPPDYIQRRELEETIANALRMERHEIVTLSGPGGIGKTSIAISVIKSFINNNNQRFDNVIWFSARDIDLLPSGPKSVRPRGISLNDFAKQYVEHVETPSNFQNQDNKPEDILADALTNTPIGSTLFVFDNFETVVNQPDTFTWIDTYIRSPNKVLITTRTRDFTGDLPINISGMSDAEASKLIRSVAISLNINKIITPDYERTLLDESSGHPYVIKIMIGELAKEQRLVKPKRIIADQESILQALFERTYSALSPAAHRVFLLLSTWRSETPSLAIEAVVMRNADERIDVRSAIDELKRMSFIEEIYPDESEESFISLPLVAFIFGQKKLKTSSLKSVVEADSDLLQAFGSINKEGIKHGVKIRINALIKSLAVRISSGKETICSVKPTLEFLGRRVPSVWMNIAQLYIEEGGQDGLELAKDALSRLLESGDASFPLAHVWQKLAEICHQIGDIQGEMQALVEMSQSSTASVEYISQLADNINRLFYVAKKDNKPTFQPEERKYLLDKLIKKFECYLNQLDATDFSRLAWLYLHVGNDRRALELAHEGLSVDQNNTYCMKIKERIEPV